MPTYFTLPDLRDVVSDKELDALMRDSGAEPVVDLDNIPADLSTAPPLERLSNIADEAEGVINSYLVRRYQLPLKEVPGAVRQAALVLTKFRAFARRDRLNDSITFTHDATLAWLESIVEGTADLIFSDPANATPRKLVRYGKLSSDTLKMSRLKM